jgi:hypothetical protein
MIFSQCARCSRFDLPSLYVVGEGILFGPHTRLVGAPHYAPSLCSVAGLLLALVCSGPTRTPSPPYTVSQLHSLPTTRTAYLLTAGAEVPAGIPRARRYFSCAGRRRGAPRARSARAVGCERSVFESCFYALLIVGANHSAVANLLGRRAGCPRRRFSKRARGGDPRLSGAKECS